MSIKKKIAVTFLLDRSNDWVEKHLLKFNFNQKNKFIFEIKKNYKTVNKQDIVFILNYTKILPESFLKNNRLNLVIHGSNLPKDRGFAPVQNQILREKNMIDICLLKAAKKVDTGDIFLRNKFRLKNSDLSPEIRKKQAIATFKIINKFLNKYPKIIAKKQMGKSTFNKRRGLFSNKLNINESIKKQFNIMRISDNEKYPAFFKIYNTKYILKIFKIKN
jgi:methionyl-tRNA formyltransferase